MNMLERPQLPSGVGSGLTRKYKSFPVTNTLAYFLGNPLSLTLYLVGFDFYVKS
jgi:hypothetical protein